MCVTIATEKSHFVRRQKSTADENEDEVPVWFLLPRRFYQRLADACEKFGVSRVNLLMRGLDLAIKEQEGKKSGRAISNKATEVSDQALSDALRRVAEMRWQSASKEERKEIGRKLAAARWGKKRGKKPSKS